jgi:hypothetical protein
MKKLLIILLFSASCSIWAQVDTGPKGGIAIPRVENNTSVAPSTSTVSPNSPFNMKPEAKKPSYYPSFAIGEKKSEFSMYTDQDKFVNRTQEYAKRTTVRPQGDASAPYKGNKDFGELHTKSDYMDILAADYGAEDGDRIRVLLNGQVVVHEFTLTNMLKPLRIRLQPGFNHIEFEAMNQGTQGPNTANFMLYDQHQKLLMNDEWALATGFKGSVMIIKDPAE